MKKKTAFNIIMVALIAVIVVCGVLAVGSFRGWFTKAGSTVATVDQVTGVPSIERDGLSYNLDVGTKLVSKDLVTTPAKARVSFSGSTLSEHSRMAITDQGLVNLEKGELFSRLKTMETDRHKLVADNAVYIVYASNDFANIKVLSGKVSVEKGGKSETIDAGKQISIMTTGYEIATLPANALDDFAIELAKASSEKLCFTAEELDTVLKDREAEKLAANGASGYVPTTNSGTSGTSGSGGTQSPSGGGAQSSGGSAAHTCTVEIRCDTILNNWGNLKVEKQGYVPSNGVILAPTTVEFTEGESAFDVLKRVVDYYGIQMEYVWSPTYSGNYIQGINYLYEFDCGSQSGWMYKVNGWFPNYGCSGFIMEDGDVMVWCYTCNGLGADVGGSVY